MPAYANDIPTHSCQKGCGRTATVAVHNTWNELMGYYCRRHGNELVKTLNASKSEAS